MDSGWSSHMPMVWITDMVNFLTILVHGKWIWLRKMVNKLTLSVYGKGIWLRNIINLLTLICLILIQKNNQ